MQNLGLIIGFIFNIFHPASRFLKLNSSIGVKSLLALLFCFGFANNPLYANSENVNFLKDFQTNVAHYEENLKTIQIQTNDGRVTLFDTLALDIVHKVTKKDSLYGFDASSLVLGMMIFPQEFQNVKMVKVTHPLIKKSLGISNDEKMASYNDFFETDGNFKLELDIRKAHSKKPSEQDQFDKELIKLDEKVSILYSVYTSSFFKIFPLKDDVNQKWVTPVEGVNKHNDEQIKQLTIELVSLIKDFKSVNSSDIQSAIKNIKNYQIQNGKNISLSDGVIQAELINNKAKIFERLSYTYILLGLVLFILFVFSILKQNFHLVKVTQYAQYTISILFLIQTIGMILRWYISGHTPWSDAYESMIYISWASILAGLIFMKRTYLATSASLLIGGIILFTAHLGFMDPQITNLVPVLKSYWLNIHVSIITASYGFFALSNMLGIMALILFALKNKKRLNLEKAIKDISSINEMSLILGLAMLSVGNFIGGVWANESWGRYWGWDPKETWALISIVVYVLILHLRFIPIIKNYQYVINIASIVGFFSILMTYFGVNFYLSGLHSYASGDPIPFPIEIFYYIGFIALLITLSFKKRNNENSTLRR